jgi:hypothetical protein
VDHVSRAGFIASLTAGAILLAATLSARGGERRAGCAGSLVPAYLRPDAIVALVAASPAPLVLVINPGSGPGPAPDPEYRRAIAAARAAGSRVLGYVPTTWGARPAADVEADVERYRAWYAVDGVFFDEAASDEAHLAHYRALADRARAEGARFVALNPGLVPARGYFDIADVVITFEGPAAAYSAHRPPADVEPERSAHLVYGASREQALRALSEAPPARYIYLTSGTLPHPWGTVPDYFAQELSALEGCR